MSALYLIAGIAIAVPYCILAGWDTDSFGRAAFVAPAFVLIWFMAAMLAGVIRFDSPHWSEFKFHWRAAFSKNQNHLQQEALWFLWGWTIYASLPIILHQSAILLKQGGYESIGSAIDTQRYASLFYLLAAVLLSVFMAVIKDRTLEIMSGMASRFKRH